MTKYVIVKQQGGAFGVYAKIVSLETLVSGHYTEDEAKDAIKRYISADKRRES